MVNEVGRVAVRVYPKTTGFAVRTKRELDKLKDMRYKVQVEVDEKKFNAQLDSIIKRTNAFLHRKENHLVFRTKLDISKRDAMAQVRETRDIYQEAADTTRVKFDSDLNKNRATAEVPVTPSLDPATFNRDLTRAVRRATRGGQNISIWGDRGTIESHAERAASIFRERLEYANREVEIFGDRSSIDEQAQRVARSTKQRLKSAMRDFNILGDPKDIEDQTTNAIDVFKRKWREAQGELNIRADLEYNSDELIKAQEHLEKIGREHNRNAELLEATDSGLKQIQERIAAAGDGIRTYRLEMERLDPHNEDQVDAWKEARRQMRRNIRTYQGLIPWTQKFREEARDLKMGLSVSSSSMTDAEAQVEQWRKRVEMNDIEIDTDISTAASEAALAFLTRPRVVDIRTRMTGQARRAIQSLGQVSSANWASIGRVVSGFATRSTGLRLLWQTARDIVDIIPRMDMMIPQLAQTVVLATTAVAGLGTLLASAVSVGADMLKSFQGVLIAPAVLAGLVSVGAVLYAAFRDINEVLPEVGEGFKELGEIASASFWDRGKAQISSFFDVLLGSLRQWTPSVSRQVAAATGALADGLREGLATHADRFFENLNRGLKGAEGGFKALGSALMGLIGAGSDSFEALGFWFTGIMQDFDSWVATNDANGNITRWINESAQALRDIGSLIYSTGSMIRTFGALVQEAGGPSLSDFAAGMREVREAMKGDAFRSMALPPLEAAFDFMSAFGAIKPQAAEAVANALDLITYSLDNMSGPVTTAFGAILDGFNDPTFINGFEKFIDGIGDFITDISPGLELLTREIGAMFGIVGTGASAFGPAFNEMLELVGDLGHGLHEGLEDFLKFFGPELESFVKSIGPGLREMADAIGELLSNDSFQGFLSNVNEKLQDLIPLATDAGRAIVELTEALFEQYDKLPPWMQDLVGWTTAIGGAAIFAAPMIKPLLAPLTGLLSIFSKPIKNLAKNSLFAALDGLSKINWKNLWTGVRPIGSAGLRGLLSRLLGVFSGPVGWGVAIASIIKPVDIFEFGSSILDALGFEGSWAQRVLDYMAGKLEDSFGNVNLLRMGSPIINGIWTAIEDAIAGWKTGGIFGAVEGFATGLWDGLTASFRAFWDIASDVLNEGWEFLTGGFRDWQPSSGIGDAIKSVLETISGLLGFDDTGAWSWSTLTSSWRSFGSDAWEAIRGWLDDQMQKLVDDFNRWEPTTALGSGFKSFTQGLADRLPGLLGFDESGGRSFGTMVNSWRDLASDIWGSVGPWLDEQIDKLWAKVREWKPVAAVIDLFEKVDTWILETLGLDEDYDSTWDAVTDAWDGIRESLEDCLNRAWDGLKAWVTSWSPVTTVIAFGAKIGGWVRDLLGIDGGWPWDCQDLADIWTTARDNLERWLSEKWEELTDSIRDWNPATAGLRFAEWLGGLIARWMGGDDGDTIDESHFAGQTWWDLIKGWFQKQWDALMDKIESWNPAGTALRFGRWLGRLVVRWIENGGPADPDTGGSTTSWWDRLKGWFQEKWNELLDAIDGWVPVNPAVTFGAWLGGLVARWINGSGGSTGDPLDGHLSGPSWWDRVKGWFQEKWDELLGAIRDWNPISVGARFGAWLWEKIREWIEGDSDDGGGEGFDFSKWEPRIKRAIQIGLIALVAAITAPLWLPIAPLAIGALILKWIFGREEDDDEGGMTTSVFERIVGWWDSIREGISDGIEEIGRLIGEIIHDVICLPQYILDEIFTDCFDEGGMFTRVKEKVLGWGGSIGSGISEGISELVEQIAGGAEAGAGAGGGGPMMASLLDRILGTSPSAVAQTLGQYGLLRGGISAFGTGVSADYGAMAESVSLAMSGMRTGVLEDFFAINSNGRAQTQAMSAAVTAATGGMRTGVLGHFSSMKSGAIGESAALRSGAVSNFLSTRDGATSSAGQMKSQYISQMVGLRTGAIGQANTLRGTLPGRLSINTSGAGSYTGSTFVSGLSRGLNAAVGIARSIAGRIRGALSFSAFGSGASIGSSFAAGLRSRTRATSIAASGLAAAARNQLPNSPASEGPFSGSGWGGWGESIGDELARGLRKSAPAVAKEAEALMHGVSSALDERPGLGADIGFEQARKRYGLAGGPQPIRAEDRAVNVTVESNSEDPLQDGRRLGGNLAYALKGAGL